MVSKKSLKKVAAGVALKAGTRLYTPTSFLVVPEKTTFTDQDQLTHPIDTVLGQGTSETTEAVAGVSRELNRFMNCGVTPRVVEEAKFDIQEFWNLPQPPPTPSSSPPPATTVDTPIDLTDDASPSPQGRPQPDLSNHSARFIQIPTVVRDGVVTTCDLTCEDSPESPPASPAAGSAPSTITRERPGLDLNQFRYRSLSEPTHGGFQAPSTGGFPPEVADCTEEEVVIQKVSKGKGKGSRGPRTLKRIIPVPVLELEAATADEGEPKPKKKRKSKGVNESTTSAAVGTDTTSTPSAATTSAAGSVEAPVKVQTDIHRYLDNRLLQFRIVPLMSERWPTRFGFQKDDHHPSANQLFYPQGDVNTILEVYHEPNIRGVCIRRYVNKPYERAINLSANDFRALHTRCEDLITHHERVTDIGNSGLPAADIYISHLDRAGNTQVLVNMYKGQAKVHIGTRSYVEEMANVNTLRRQPSSAVHCGTTVSLATLKDIVKRVGPLLERADGFYRDEVSSD